MRKIILLVLVSFLSKGLYSQQASVSPSRMTIPKTTISLVPPVNFAPSEYYDGFLHKSTYSTITAKIETGKGYLDFNKRFSKEYFQSMSLVLLKQEEVKTKDMTGTLYLLSYVLKETNMQRYMLVTGDIKNTYFVMANFPVGFKNKVSEPIKRSLMTVQFK